MGEQPGILDWYTILVGILALAALMLHGALWVALKTGGTVPNRSLHIARLNWWAVAALTVLVTFTRFRIQPAIAAHFRSTPWGAVFPVLAVIGFAGTRWFIARGQELKSFLASSCYLAGMLLSVVFAVFPMVLPARNSLYSLTIENSRAATYGLKVALIWWIFGMLLVTGYFAYVYRSIAGKVSLGKHADQ